jgi:hypothetical protein
MVNHYHQDLKGYSVKMEYLKEVLAHYQVYKRVDFYLIKMLEKLEMMVSNVTCTLDE